MKTASKLTPKLYRMIREEESRNLENEEIQEVMEERISEP
jgi:hypothetical protein